MQDRSNRTELPDGPAPRDKSVHSRSVIALACYVALLLVITAYFCDRGGGVDEIGLLNPSYMVLHTGRITYPIHGYFHSMVVHPPVHYLIIGWILRAGLHFYYAEATPALLMLLLCIFVIVRTPFPVALKVGLLYGTYIPITLLSKFDLEFFGTRPESHLNAAWLLGLILLEWGRLENWSLTKLFAGAFVITYASGLHYYAIPALFGAGAYAVWAVYQLGWRKSMPKLMAIAAGGMLFGLPYMLLFVIPHRNEIWNQLSAAQAGGSIAQALRLHMEQYRYWIINGIRKSWLTPPLRLCIPLALISTPLLLISLYALSKSSVRKAMPVLPCSSGVVLHR
jgi:hypothetical protein